MCVCIRVRVRRTTGPVSAAAAAAEYPGQALWRQCLRKRVARMRVCVRVYGVRVESSWGYGGAAAVRRLIARVSERETKVAATTRTIVGRPGGWEVDKLHGEYDGRTSEKSRL